MMTKGATILPFRALRYNLDEIDDLSQVIAPPYDVISPEQKVQLYNKSEHNIAWLDVTQKDTEMPSPERYEKAARDFQEWQAQDILQRDETPGIYVYEQVFAAPSGEQFTRRGFYGLRRLESFGEGSVFPHEQTLAGPKKDRLALMKATQAQLSPIFGLFSDSSGQAAALLVEAVKQAPLFDMRDDAGQGHRLWHITDPEWIQALQTAVEESPFLIADGHHRYETALAFKEWRNAKQPDNDPEAPQNYVLMFCEDVEDPGLLVLPTHRLVQNRPGFSADEFLAKVRDYFQVEEMTSTDTKSWIAAVADKGKGSHAFGLIFPDDAKRYVVSIESSKLASVPALSDVPHPLQSLDAKILHRCFLEDFIGFGPKDHENLEYIQYLKSDKALMEKIEGPGAQVGILMNPAPLSQIRAIAEAGQFMPPKTTFFYPKLPTGLLISVID